MKLRTRIVLLALIPAIIVSLCQYASSMYQLEKGTTSEAYEGMQATAVMASTLLDAIDTGNYQVKDGSLYKGDDNLSENADFFDALKEKSGYDATLFYGDMRYLTTLKDAISSVMQIDKNIQGIAKTSNAQAQNAASAGDSVSEMGMKSKKSFRCRMRRFPIPMRFSRQSRKMLSIPLAASRKQRLTVSRQGCRDC